MRKAILILTALAAAALVAPLAAQAQAKGDDGLQITLRAPVNFVTTADCPTGAAVYGISLHGQTGSGTNCILDEVLTDCPSGLTAQFCESVPVRVTLSLDGSTIEADVTIFEAWTCDATCNVVQRWSGTVTTGTRRFRQLEGGSVSGGGLFAFDSTTFELRAFDEVLVVARADD